MDMILLYYNIILSCDLIVEINNNNANEINQYKSVIDNTDVPIILLLCRLTYNGRYSDVVITITYSSDGLDEPFVLSIRETDNFSFNKANFALELRMNIGISLSNLTVSQILINVEHLVVDFISINSERVITV